MTNTERIAINQLKAVPEFTAFAEREMETDPEFWKSAERESSGGFAVVASAVVEVGGGDRR